MNLDDLDIVKIFLCKQKLWLHAHLMDLKYILEEGLKFHISGALNHWSWSKAHQTMMLAWSTVPERNMSLSTIPCFTTATLSLSGKKVMQKNCLKSPYEVLLTQYLLWLVDSSLHRGEFFGIRDFFDHLNLLGNTKTYMSGNIWFHMTLPPPSHTRAKS